MGGGWAEPVKEDLDPLSQALSTGVQAIGQVDGARLCFIEELICALESCIVLSIENGDSEKGCFP